LNFQETLDYLYESLPVFQKIGGAAFNKDLGKTRLLLSNLNNPHEKFKSIHIAGTNGKGSISSMLAAIFQTAGYKTGLYTSPHLKSFTERIKVNGVSINEESVIKFVEKTKSLIEEIKPSFFELTVAMAFDYFVAENIDVAIVEVGMGGRLDSTNVINPELALITNISYDHQQFLGDTLPEIAHEKAGIIKEGIPVIISELQEACKAVFLNTAQEKNASILFASEKYKTIKRGFSSGFMQAELWKEGEPYIKNILSPLGGNYQLKNIAGVAAAFDLLSGKFTFSPDTFREGIKNVCSLTGLKGRWQVLNECPFVVCDTGHNEAGIRETMEQIKSIAAGKLHLILGFVKDKDLKKIMPLLPQKANYYFCQPSISRALDAEELREKALVYGLGGIVRRNVNDALNLALTQANPEDLIFIGGSTFTVADLANI